MNISQSVGDTFFNHFHQNNLVYNTCWEDPRCDKALLDIDQQSEVVMITSAGCNALSYLIDRPEKVHCIDVNPRQNALLALKMAMIKTCDYDDFYRFFGTGRHQEHDSLYNDQIRTQLPKYAQDFWDHHIGYFGNRNLNRNFYYSGTSGLFAWLLAASLKLRKQLYKQVASLFEADSLEQQREIYNEIESSVLNRIVQFFVNRHLTMYLLGVPISQQKMFVERYQQGAFGFIKSRLRHVFSELPLSDNYFYRVYFFGEYSKDCCPDYLKNENYNLLKSESEKVDLHNQTISQFLLEQPGNYSHYVLLDHQDWLAENRYSELDEEWRLILKNSQPGTKILMRSASENLDFIPPYVHQYVHFEESKTIEQHHRDRVGTYASVHLGIVQTADINI